MSLNNSTDEENPEGVTASTVDQFMRRLEYNKQEKADLAEDLKALKEEIKAKKLDPKALDLVLKLEEMADDPDKLIRAQKFWTTLMLISDIRGLDGKLTRDHNEREIDGALAGDEG